MISIILRRVACALSQCPDEQKNHRPQIGAMAQIIAVPPNFGARLKQDTLVVAANGASRRFLIDHTIVAFRTPLSGGLHCRLCRKCFQPLAPCSLGQTQQLLFPINALLSIYLSDHYRERGWIVKPLQLAIGML
jgi:hypothetical protein